MLDVDPLAAGADPAGQRPVPRQHRDSVAFERCPNEGRHFHILAPEDAGSQFDLRDVRAEPGESLGELGADRPAAKDDKAFRRLRPVAQRLPQRVGGEIARLLDPWQGRHEGRGAGRDDDGAAGEPPGAAIIECDLDRPGIDNARMSPRDLDAKVRITLDAVMRLDPGDDRMDPRHDLGEGNGGFGGGKAVAVRMAHLMGGPGASDQGLGGNAAVVQAVAAHLVRLDQSHPRPGRGGDVGRDEAGRSSADDDQVAVEARGAIPAFVDPLPAQDVQREPRDPGEDAEQRERGQERRRDKAADAVDLGQLRAGIHIDRGSGQHSGLADQIEGRDADRRQPHQQVDGEEGDDRDEAQREKVEGAVALEPGVDRPGAVAEFRMDPVAQQVPGHEEGERGAEGRGEGNQDEPAPEAEDRPRGKSHPHGERKRQGGDGDIEGEEDRRERQRSFATPGFGIRDVLADLRRVELAAKHRPDKDKGRSETKRDQQFLQRGGPVAIPAHRDYRDSRLFRADCDSDFTPLSGDRVAPASIGGTGECGHPAWSRAGGARDCAHEPEIRR